VRIQACPDEHLSTIHTQLAILGSGSTSHETAGPRLPRGDMVANGRSCGKWPSLASPSAPRRAVTARAHTLTTWSPRPRGEPTPWKIFAATVPLAIRGKPTRLTAVGGIHPINPLCRSKSYGCLEAGTSPPQSACKCKTGAGVTHPMNPLWRSEFCPGVEAGTSPHESGRFLKTGIVFSDRPVPISKIVNTSSTIASVPAWIGSGVTGGAG
jgi:hypothetical protein